jgi:hypothetical protein
MPAPVSSTNRVGHRLVDTLEKIPIKQGRSMNQLSVFLSDAVTKERVPFAEVCSEPQRALLGAVLRPRVSPGVP